MRKFYRETRDLWKGANIVDDTRRLLSNCPHLDSVEPLGRCTEAGNVDDFLNVKASSDAAVVDDFTLFGVEACRRVYGNKYEYTLECAKRFIRAYLPRIKKEYQRRIDAFKEQGQKEIAHNALAQWYEENKTNPLLHVCLEKSDAGMHNIYTLQDAVTSGFNAFRYFAYSGEPYIRACCEKAGQAALDATTGYVEAAKLQAELDALIKKADSNNIFEVMSVSNNPAKWKFKFDTDYGKPSEYVQFNAQELEDLIFAWNEAWRNKDERTKAAQLLAQRNPNSLV